MRDRFGSPFDFFSLPSASMTTCDGRTPNVRVGDVVRLLDDNQYRVLKITPPPGPVVLKRTNYTTYRSFLRAPLQLFIPAPHIVSQSPQTDPPPVDADDHLACAVLQCCAASAVHAYNQGRPYCLGDFHVDQHSFVGHNLQKGGHYDNAKFERMKN